MVVQIAVFGCSKSSAKAGSAVGAATQSSIIDSMDIKDASKLFVTGNSSGLMLDGTELKPQTLYKVSATGVLAEVTYKDYQGKLVTLVEAPMGIETPNLDTVIFTYPTLPQYLVSKQTGKAYQIDQNIHLAKVKSDVNSNMWAVKAEEATSSTSVVKLSFKDNNLVIEDVSAKGDTVADFWMTDADAIVYQSATFKSIVDGKFANLGDLSCANRAKDGRIFGYKKNNTGFVDKIYNAITGELLKEMTFTNSNAIFVCGESGLRIDSKIITPGYVPFSSQDALEVFNEADLSFDYVPLIAKLSGTSASDKFVYGIVGGKLYKVDVAAKTETEITLAGVLEVKTAQSSKNDVLTVTGNLEDGSSFVGEVTDGQVSITSKIGVDGLIVIAPLN